MIPEYINQDECWLWAGLITPDGYGRQYYYDNGHKAIYAHRLIYEHYKGDIPKGLQIDHLCRNRRCVNPNHLEAVSRKQNILRGNAFSGVNARKTHCKNSHKYTADNTYYIKRNGVFRQRECKECRKLFNLKARQLVK